MSTAGARESRFTRRGRCGALALAVVAAACWLAAANASAATYGVWSCRGPAGEPVPSAAWRLDAFDDWNEGVVRADECGAGGPLLLALAPTMDFPPPQKPTALATFDVPLGTRIAGYTLWRSIAVAAAVPEGDYYYAAAVRERAGATTYEDGCASTLSMPSFSCSNSGDPDEPLDPSNRFERTSLDLDELQLWAGCTSAGCEAPSSPPAAELRLFRSHVLVEDDIAPDPPSLSGSLALARPLTGAGSLVVASTDVGGGIAAMTLSIDGGPPRTLPLSDHFESCREPYFMPRPCPAQAARAFAIDTEDLASGMHTASGTVVDAAGNVTAFGPVAFSVARRQAPPSDAGGLAASTADVPGPARLRLRTRGAVVEHSLGRAPRISGVLMDGAGRPIGGASLTVEVRGLERPFGPVKPLPPVSTTPAGRFALRVPGAGARWVTIAYEPLGGRPPLAATQFTVRTRTSLSLARRPARLRRGQSVLFRGRLRGAGAAARGAVVEIQAIVSGRWRAVATVRAARSGDFRWRYRFTRVNRDTIFSFRALVRDTPGWPWPTVRSKRVQVRVEGP